MPVKFEEFFADLALLKSAGFNSVPVVAFGC